MYSMKDICQKTGMTYQTLKFYCNEGLIFNVKRDANHYRVFDEQDLDLIISLTCLRKCGFSIREMKVFLELVAQGNHTIKHRQQMLDEHKIDLLKKIKEIIPSPILTKKPPIIFQF